MARGRFRSGGAAFALATLSCLAGCFAQQGAPPPDAASEDELRFRATVVDKSLPDVDALGYEIDLRVNDVPGRETFAADVKGSYVATRDLAELTLDFEGNEIDDVLIGGRTTTYRREGAKLIIKLPQPVASGRTFTSRIRYHGTVVQADGANPNDFAAFGGFNVRQRNAERKRIYSSLSWPSKARRWLPLRDHPSDGAMVAMNLTFPKSFTVISNGKQVARNEQRRRHEHLALRGADADARVRLPRRRLRGLEGRGHALGVRHPDHDVHVRERRALAACHLRRSPEGARLLRGQVRRYRWGSASFIEEPIFGGGMEHASVVSMDETLFPDPVEARKTAFHELAHHWSGNLVRIRTWNDFWLSEGFTEYLTARFLSANDGPEAKKTVFRGYLTEALAADRSNAHPLRPADPEIDVLTIFDAISYQKGALVLHALERVVGEEKLTEFLKGWFDRHAFGAVLTSDLQKELSEASRQGPVEVLRGLRLLGGYHPEVRVTFARLARRDRDQGRAAADRRARRAASCSRSTSTSSTTRAVAERVDHRRHRQDDDEAASAPRVRRRPSSSTPTS